MQILVSGNKCIHCKGDVEDGREFHDSCSEEIEKFRIQRIKYELDYMFEEMDFVALDFRKDYIVDNINEICHFTLRHTMFYLGTRINMDYGTMIEIKEDILRDREEELEEELERLGKYFKKKWGYRGEITW